MKFSKKLKDCDCRTSRNDLWMAIGAAIFAIGKAIYTNHKFQKERNK